MTSREIVECAYCNKRDRRDNFKKNKHFEKNHPGRSVAYKTLDTGTTPLMDFLSKKRKRDDDCTDASEAAVGSMPSHSPQATQVQAQSSSSSSSSAQPQPDISGSMDPATVGAPDELAAPSDGGSPAQVSQSSDISRNQSESANQLTGRTGFFPIFDNPASMGAMLRAQSAQIREQTALLKCMDEKIDSLGVTERHRRDLVEFKRAVLSTGPFRINEVFQQVECNVCNQYKYSLLASERPGGIGRIGVFQISEDFDSVKRRNLLASLRDHLGTVTHERCAKLADSGKRQKDMEAEMCLARCVYFSLMEGLGGLGYERLLALCSLNGTDLGDQGHSRNSFKALFTKAMVSELKERISSLFKHQWACFAGRASPFAISCDKVTIRRRTLQPVGAFTMVNGMIKVYLLDAPVATAKSGDALTDLLITTIKKYFDIPFVQASMVGVATDGEYVNLRLGPRLHDSLDLDPSDLTHSWCLAHRLELACTDASKGITNLRSELHPHMPSRHGKSFEELEKLSAEKGTRFYTPVGFICTRWASSEHRVFKNFSANYPLLVMLDGAAQILRADWMVKFLIALDIMNLVASASGGAQTVNFRPWQTAAAINALNDKLIVIAESLTLLSGDIHSVENMTQLNDSSLDICDLPSLKKARLNQTPGGGKWEGVQLTEVPIVRVRMAVEFMEAWVRQLMSGVKERILKTFPQWLVAASKLFSGQALFGDSEGLKEHDVALDDNNFPEVAEAMDDSSLLELAGGFVISRVDYNLDLETLVAQYTLLKHRLQRNHGSWPQCTDGKIDMCALWGIIHTSPDMYMGAEEILFFGANLALRTFNESIVESICSCLNSFDPRRHLGHGVMVEEGLLIWNRLGLGHESLDGFLRDSLRRMPESYTGCRRKLNADAQRRQNRYQISQVIDRVLSSNPNSEISASQPSLRSKLPNAGNQCSDDDSGTSP